MLEASTPDGHTKVHRSDIGSEIPRRTPCGRWTNPPRRQRYPIVITGDFGFSSTDSERNTIRSAGFIPIGLISPLLWCRQQKGRSKKKKKSLPEEGSFFSFCCSFGAFSLEERPPSVKFVSGGPDHRILGDILLSNVRASTGSRSSKDWTRFHRPRCTKTTRPGVIGPSSWSNTSWCSNNPSEEPVANRRNRNNPLEEPVAICQSTGLENTAEAEVRQPFRGASRRPLRVVSIARVTVESEPVQGTVGPVSSREADAPGRPGSLSTVHQTRLEMPDHPERSDTCRKAVCVSNSNKPRA